MIHETSERRIGNVSRPERRGVSRRTVIEEAKATVPTVDLADRLCGPGKLRRAGRTWTALCPLPDHDEKTPSFTVYPDSNSWFCYGCLRGGDVVELARFAWGYSKADAKMAAADVLHEFGYEIPSRQPAWFRKQERQQPVRDAIEEAAVEHFARRLFRRMCLPTIAKIADQNERQEEADLLWDACLEIGAIWRAGRRPERRAS